MGTDGSVGGARVEGIFKNSRVWSFKEKALLIRFLFILKYNENKNKQDRKKLETEDTDLSPHDYHSTNRASP